MADGFDSLVENPALLKATRHLFVEEIPEHLETVNDSLVLPTSAWTFGFFFLGLCCCRICNTKGCKCAVVETDAHFLAELISHPEVEVNRIYSHDELEQGIGFDYSGPGAGECIKQL